MCKKSWERKKERNPHAIKCTRRRRKKEGGSIFLRTYDSFFSHQDIPYYDCGGSLFCFLIWRHTAAKRPQKSICLPKCARRRWPFLSAFRPYVRGHARSVSPSSSFFRTLARSTAGGEVGNFAHLTLLAWWCTTKCVAAKNRNPLCIFYQRGSQSSFQKPRGKEESSGVGGEKGEQQEEEGKQHQRETFPPPHLFFLYLAERGLKCERPSPTPLLQFLFNTASLFTYGKAILYNNHIKVKLCCCCCCCSNCLT